MTETTLRITHGAGSSHPLPSSIAEEYSGDARTVLRQIVAEHIKDPGLLETLGDSHLALEQFYEETDGQVREAPFSPQTDWQEIVAKIEQTDVELGVARRHAGGSC